MCQLFKAKARAEKRHDHYTTLSELAMSDLTFWRAISLITMISPFFLGAPLHRVRDNKKPDFYMRTDAAGRGAGVKLQEDDFAKSNIEVEGLEDDIAIRWTDDEVAAFERFAKGMGSSPEDAPPCPTGDENKGRVPINILEFYAAIFYIFLWADLFRGKVVHIEVDNTAALSWLLAARVNGNWAADTLAKIFTLFCLAYGITITTSHVQGIQNTYADFRSRSETLDEQARRRDLDLLSDSSTLGGKSRRWKACRKLLLDILTSGAKQQSLLTPRGLIQLVSALGTERATT